MSVFTPLERGLMLETSKKEVLAKDILEAIKQMKDPKDVISAERQIKIKTTPYQRYILKLEKVVER